jgi:hypothetical protein
MAPISDSTRTSATSHLSTSEAGMIRQAHGAARSQRLRLFQIECVETLGEPAIDPGEKIEGLLPLAMLIAARPALCLLLARGPTMAKTSLERARAPRFGKRTVLAIRATKER